MEIGDRTDWIGISLMFVFRSVSFGAPSPSSPQSKCIDNLLHGLKLGWACYMSLQLFATTAQTPKISTLWYEGVISKHTLEGDNPNPLRLLYSEINTRQKKWLKMKCFSLLHRDCLKGGLCAHQKSLVFFSCSIARASGYVMALTLPLYPVGAEAWPRCLLLCWSCWKVFSIFVVILTFFFMSFSCSGPWRCEIFLRQQEAHAQRMLELQGGRTHFHSREKRRGKRRAGSQH